MTQLTLNFQADSDLDGEMRTSSSAVASHANHIALLGKGLEKMIPGISGRRCCESFEKFPQNGLWAKMFSGLLIGMEDWYSTRCKLTWKLQGTKYNRMYFRLQASTHPTNVTGASLLPTPESFDWNSARHPELWVIDKKKYADRGINLHCNLRQQARLGILPTPNASDSLNPNNKENHDVKRGYLRGYAVNDLLPTPRVKGHGNSHQRISDGKMDDLTTLAKMGMLPTPRAANPGSRPNGKGGKVLNEEAQIMAGMRKRGQYINGILPTPTTTDYKGAYSPEGMVSKDGIDRSSLLRNIYIHTEDQQFKAEDGTTSQLNPLFVAEMMGFPVDWTVLPFQSGETKASKDTEMQS